MNALAKIVALTAVITPAISVDLAATAGAAATQEGLGAEALCSIYETC